MSDSSVTINSITITSITNYYQQYSTTFGQTPQSLSFLVSSGQRIKVADPFFGSPEHFCWNEYLKDDSRYTVSRPGRAPAGTRPPCAGRTSHTCYTGLFGCIICTTISVLCGFCQLVISSVDRLDA